MPKLTFLKSFWTRTLLIGYFALAVLLFSSALLELFQSKKELLALMEKQARTLLETAVVASENTLITNEYLESFLEERLLNNAFYLKHLYEKGQLSANLVQKFAEENHLHRINIWSAAGERLLSSHPDIYPTHSPPSPPTDILAPLFSGLQDTLIIGLKQARYQAGLRYAVAVATKNRDAIVINLDAGELLAFRRQIGIGRLVQSISHNPNIVYVAIQDSSGILAASENVDSLESVTSSSFFIDAIKNHQFATRLSRFQDEKILEAVMPLFYDNIFVGLMRTGISLMELQAIKHRIYRRIGIITSVVLFIGILFFTLLISRQNLNLLQKQYQIVETYSSNIIQSVSDAIIVLDSGKRITLFNQAAAALFQIRKEAAVGPVLTEFLDPQHWSAIFDSSSTIQEIDCRIAGQSRTLLISKSDFSNVEGKINHVLIIRDLTNRKNLERQIQRQERLSAMGELASGVAHEIRNPLNTISTIVQQLDKDFEPIANAEDFHKLAQLVYKEVLRINQTIEDFLRFARPEPLKIASFPLSELLDELKSQYSSMTDLHHISLQIEQTWEGIVQWDREKMRQVFMNLFQNAVDAIGKDGTIRLIVNERTPGLIQIRVEDTGPGIPNDVQKRIFDLYFTTKAKGTGIGLSVVQQIVNEHRGMIFLDSTHKKGAAFVLELPVSVDDKSNSSAASKKANQIDFIESK